MPSPGPTLLADGLLARRAAGLPTQTVTLAEVADAFLASRVFASRTGDDARPGLWLSGTEAMPSVCAFSSLALLARAVVDRPGTPTTYLTTSGADLLAQLPAGCGVVLDPLGPTAVLLPYALLTGRQGGVIA